MALCSLPSIAKNVTNSWLSDDLNALLCMWRNCDDFPLPYSYQLDMWSRIFQRGAIITYIWLIRALWLFCITREPLIFFLHNHGFSQIIPVSYHHGPASESWKISRYLEIQIKSIMPFWLMKSSSAVTYPIQMNTSRYFITHNARVCLWYMICYNVWLLVPNSIKNCCPTNKGSYIVKIIRW